VDVRPEEEGEGDGVGTVCRWHAVFQVVSTDCCRPLAMIFALNKKTYSSE
jgi:hypothetical protein